jgi:hypothetical protein
VRLYVCKAGILYSVVVLVHSELLGAHPGGVTLVVQQYIRPSEVFSVCRCEVVSSFYDALELGSSHSRVSNTIVPIPFLRFP